MRTLFALLMILGVSASAGAKKSSYNLTGRESSGFNALNHVLQKPLDNDTFPETDKGLDKHIFIGAGGGVSVIGDAFSGKIKPGGRLGGQIGTWFTPLHGIRLGADAGLHSIHEWTDRTWFGALRAEYLLNLSALLRGYDPTRKFELIGAVGLEYQRIRQNGLWSNNIGIGMSMQARFNVAPSFFLFVEPRLAMMSGRDRQYDYPNSWHRFRADVSFNVGLGYRILQGRYRRMGSTVFSQINDDNLYFGADAGVWVFPRNSFKPNNPIAGAYVGKMVSSTSGFQATVAFAQHRGNNGDPHKYLAIGSLDYVLNLDNAFGGYRPDQVFQMLMNVGVSGGYVPNAGNRVISPGLSLGLTGMFRLSPNWGIYIHPQLYAFKRKFAQALGSEHAPMTAIDLGVRYTLGDFSRLHPRSYEEYASAKHWFITAGGGFDYRLRDNFGNGGNAYVGFGKRFTPISSWRLTLGGDVFPKMPFAVALTAHADYMSSITTAMMGYDPDRLFDLQMTLGVFAGIADYEASITKTYGLSGGLQANFRLNSHLDLYIEPQFLAVNAPYKYGARHWVPEMRANIGLRYKLGTPVGGRGYISDTPYGDHRNFAGISGGISAFSGSISAKSVNITGIFDIAVGRWFTMISGARAVYANDWINRDDKLHYIGSVHADYLMNLTSLIDRSADRRFHIIGAVGVGIGFSKEANKASGIMTYGGVQFRYNLPYNIDVHIEPGANFWANRVIPNPTSKHRFEMSGRLAAGLSFRF